MGFTLSLLNATGGANYWDAAVASMGITSNPLPITSTWTVTDTVPSGGVTVIAITYQNAVAPRGFVALFNIGPIQDGVNYVYDCGTGQLSVKPVIDISSIINLMVTMMVIMMIMEMMTPMLSM